MRDTNHPRRDRRARREARARKGWHATPDALCSSCRVNPATGPNGRCWPCHTLAAMVGR